jgi:hypothetical protein
MSATPGTGSITVASATAIGVGGMMGAGLYTLLGLASTTAGVWLPVAFLVGGAVTIFSVYSYAKLGAKYPSRGGAAQFLIRCFGDGVIAGGLNVFQFLGWIIAMALCASFAGYIRALLPFERPPGRARPSVSGSSSRWFRQHGGLEAGRRSELFVVTIELVILAVFAVFGLMKADPGWPITEITTGSACCSPLDCSTSPEGLAWSPAQRATCDPRVAPGDVPGAGHRGGRLRGGERRRDDVEFCSRWTPIRDTRCRRPVPEPWGASALS